MAGGPLSGPADWATDVIEAAGYAGVGTLVALANVLPPVPVEVLLPLAGFVAGDGRLLFLGVVVAATVGSVVGALVLYGLGRWLGEARVRHLIKRFGWFLHLKESDLDRAHRWFEHNEAKAVVIGRMVPGIRKAIPIPAGIAGMPIPRFAAYTALANGFTSSVLIGLGWVLGDQWLVVRRYAHFLEYAVMIAVAAAVLWFVWDRWAVNE